MELATSIEVENPEWDQTVEEIRDSLWAEPVSHLTDGSNAAALPSPSRQPAIKSMPRC